MEVTKSNFNVLLPQIKESINNSTFLAIDCEFSGLSTNNEINSFDTPKQYYDKIRKGSRDFLLIQYGLCSFRFDKETKSFKQRAFNFYVFPKAVPKYVPDQQFLCQVSSIDFLVAQNFDFNKLFKQGIPYLNCVQETKYKETLCESQKFRAQNNLSNNFDIQNRVIATKEADKILLQNVSEQIEAFMKSDDEELILPKYNGFLRLLIYQMVRIDFDDKVNIQTKPDKMVVTKFISFDQRKADLNKLIEEENYEFDSTVGFTKVIKLLIDSKKLIVGHNMVLDLLHTIDKFVTPLPEDYEQFKQCTHNMFPNLLDTKYFSVCDPFSNLIASNVLGHLLETLGKPPFIVPKIELEAEGFGYNLIDKKEHEAGYDAYITGICFLTMWRQLGKLYLSHEHCNELDIFNNFDLLKPYINKLFLMRLQDSPYIHLDGEDANPSRDHVFYLTFPKEWKSSDISQLFSPFGAVHIAWISDKSAYVSLMKRHEAAVALSTLSQSDTYHIMTYAKRQSQLASTSHSPKFHRNKHSDEYLSNKRRKLCSRDLPVNKSIDAEQEQSDNSIQKDEVQSETIPIAKAGRKRTISKTFEEDNTWD